MPSTFVAVLLILTCAHCNGVHGFDIQQGGVMTESLTLTKFDSPYRIASNVLVTEHVTLTVQPSVELRFSPGVMLAINGTLIAEVSTDCHNTVIIRIILVCTASLQIANTIDYTGVYSPPHTRAYLEFLSGGGRVGEGEGGSFFVRQVS